MAKTNYREIAGQLGISEALAREMDQEGELPVSLTPDGVKLNSHQTIRVGTRKGAKPGRRRRSGRGRGREGR